MATAWTEVQTKLWERWTREVESSVDPQNAETWERSSSKIIDAWANSVKLALRAQLGWVALWVRTFGEDEAAPKEVIERSHLMYEMMEAWTEAQLELWDGWFASLRKVGASASTGAFADVS
jgi:hypothetical protein